MDVCCLIILIWAEVWVRSAAKSFQSGIFLPGEWSEWSPWSGECLGVCRPRSDVKETRIRTCSRKLRFCKGPKRETRTCEEITSYGCYPEAEFSTSTCGTRIPLVADTSMMKLEMLEHKFESMMNDSPKGSFVNKRIIRGHAPESVGEYPWLVQFVVKDYVVCTGSVISEALILTAAHCFDEIHDYDLYVGKYHTDRQFIEPTSQKLSIKKFSIHPKYDFDTADYDFAVIEVNERVKLNNFVNTICLPSPNLEVDERSMCFVAGWGVTAYDTVNYPKTLQEVYIPILKPSVCAQKFNSKKNYFTDNMICAGYLNSEADACQGDSGAPMVCKRETGQFYIGGIVSWGNGCAKKGYPGVYSKVSRAVPWVESFMYRKMGSF